MTDDLMDIYLMTGDENAIDAAAEINNIWVNFLLLTLEPNDPRIAAELSLQ